MLLPHLSATLLWTLLAAGNPAPNTRTLLMFEPLRDDASPLYVGARLTTVLRLDQPCVAERTALLGWEGRFEPVLCQGKAVYLYPLLNLAPEDRFLLQVTLADGSQLPFTVMAGGREPRSRGVDQQVDVFTRREETEGLRAALALARGEQEALSAQVARYQVEASSVDHAWAALLAGGQAKQTPFTRMRIERLKENGVEMTVVFFAAREQGKAAVVLDLRNMAGTTWRLGATGLTSAEEPAVLKSFALRMNAQEILPGASARMAVVVDRGEFTTARGLVDLTLDVSEKEGPLQLTILLDRRLLEDKK